MVDMGPKYQVDIDAVGKPVTLATSTHREFKSSIPVDTPGMGESANPELPGPPVASTRGTLVGDDQAPPETFVPISEEYVDKLETSIAEVSFNHV